MSITSLKTWYAPIVKKLSHLQARNVSMEARLISKISSNSIVTSTHLQVLLMNNPTIWRSVLSMSIQTSISILWMMDKILGKPILVQCSLLLLRVLTILIKSHSIQLLTIRTLLCSTTQKKKLTDLDSKTMNWKRISLTKLLKLSHNSSK